MAKDSYSPIYNTPKRQLWSERDRIGYFVLECLALHADKLGITWIGAQAIGEKVGYSPQSVRGALADLARRGWIAIVPSDKGHTIQISPDVMYIREDLETVAQATFSAMFSVMKNIQPEHPYKPEQPEQPNQPEEPNTTTYTMSQREDGITADIPQEKAKKQKTARSAETAKNANGTKPKTARSAEQKAPPSSAEPPQNWREPLPDVNAETLAHVMQARFNTRLPQARSLVDMYGIEKVNKAVEWVQYESGKREVESPMGLLVWWLKNNLIEPQQPVPNTNAVSDLTDTTRYSGGQYADFIYTGAD